MAIAVRLLGAALIIAGVACSAAAQDSAGVNIIRGPGSGAAGADATNGPSSGTAPVVNGTNVSSTLGVLNRAGGSTAGSLQDSSGGSTAGNLTGTPGLVAPTTGGSGNGIAGGGSNIVPPGNDSPTR